jgi:hypothetical protein
MLTPGAINSVPFMSGCLNSIAIYVQQLLYAVACLLDVINDEDSQTRAIFIIHKLSLLMLNNYQPRHGNSKVERLEAQARVDIPL